MIDRLPGRKCPIHSPVNLTGNHLSHSDVSMDFSDTCSSPGDQPVADGPLGGYAAEPASGVRPLLYFFSLLGSAAFSALIIRSPHSVHFKFPHNDLPVR
jgi:hypothetical protein